MRCLTLFSFFEERIYAVSSFIIYKSHQLCRIGLYFFCPFHSSPSTLKVKLPSFHVSCPLNALNIYEYSAGIYMLFHRSLNSHKHRDTHTHREMHADILAPWFLTVQIVLGCLRRIPLTGWTCSIGGHGCDLETVLTALIKTWWEMKIKSYLNDR